MLLQKSEENHCKHRHLMLKIFLSISIKVYVQESTGNYLNIGRKTYTI